jgi:hypothetical protein
MNNFEKNIQRDFFFIDKSFINEREHCVHVPVSMPKIKNTPDINIDIDHVDQKVRKKYPDINFTGRWGTSSNENGVNEYLFYFE